MLHWWKFSRRLSAYRDHSLRPEEFRALWRHLYHCSQCREEVGEMEHLGLTLRRLPAPPIPSRLIPDLRIAIMQERARKERPSPLWRWKTQWGHLAFPGATGLLSAILLFGLFGSQFAAPLRQGPDVPLDLRTSAYPRYSYQLEFDSDTEMVVQLLIDRRGRVADYTILAGEYTPEDVRRLRNTLLFAVFEPAMVFGTPISGNVVLVSVRG